MTKIGGNFAMKLQKIKNVTRKPVIEHLMFTGCVIFSAVSGVTAMMYGMFCTLMMEICYQRFLSSLSLLPIIASLAYAISFGAIAASAFFIIRKANRIFQRALGKDAILCSVAVCLLFAPSLLLECVLVWIPGDILEFVATMRDGIHLILLFVFVLTAFPLVSVTKIAKEYYERRGYFDKKDTTKD